MRPVLFYTHKKVMPWHHQCAALLQALVELLAGDGQPLKPQPQEDGSLWFVYLVGQVSQLFPKPLHGLL